MKAMHRLWSSRAEALVNVLDDASTVVNSLCCLPTVALVNARWSCPGPASKQIFPILVQTHEDYVIDQCLKKKKGAYNVTKY